MFLPSFYPPLLCLVLCDSRVHGTSNLNVKPEVRVVIMSQMTGYLKASSASLNTAVLASFWQSHLNFKFNTDGTWPFKAVVELYDCKSDMDYTLKFLQSRFKNISLPPITVLMGPENKALSKPVQVFSSIHNIPYVSHRSFYDFPRPAIRNNSFSIPPPTMFIHAEAILAFVDMGVKTMVTVANTDFPNNVEACFGAAPYAVDRGIAVLQYYPLSQSMNRSQIVNIVRNIRDVYNPDAILWCDYYNVFPEFTDTFNPMPMFRDLDYLPKALTFLDTLEAPGIAQWKQEGLFRYVTGGAFTSDRMTGQDHTEGNTPYSSIFRPNNPVTSWADVLQFGSSRESPSSAALFYSWYRNVTGTSPIRLTVDFWSSLEVVEAALYRAAKLPFALEDGKLSASEVMIALRNLQLTTPSGRIVLNENGDNTYSGSVLLQDLSSDSADIVYPLKARSATFVYPMPTWRERVYTWQLLGSPSELTSLVISIMCCVVFVAIAVTAVLHRQDLGMRMVHYLHVVLLCVAGSCVCLSLSLLWQNDCTLQQCDSQLWATLVPGSFIIHLVNMKAFRLSEFIRTSSNGRRPKSFTHLRALRLATYWVLLTVVVLIIVTIAFPLQRTRVVTDPHRPILDEYHCVPQLGTKVILGLLFVEHAVVSLVSVVLVRNGMEDFHDGLVIKEALILLYFFVGTAVVMQLIGLSSAHAYLYRSVCISIGFVLCVLRLMISRCYMYWVPSSMRDKLGVFYDVYLRPLVNTVHHASQLTSHAQIGATNVPLNYLVDDENAFIFNELPTDNKIEEMITVLSDPTRLLMMQSIADKTLTSENIRFLLAVKKFQKECPEILLHHASTASDEIRVKAKELFRMYLCEFADDEVNVSSTTREVVDRHIREWDTIPAVLNLEEATHILDTDVHRRIHVFDMAFKDICVMTYQNLWVKFRAEETANFASAN